MKTGTITPCSQQPCCGKAGNALFAFSEAHRAVFSINPFHFP